MDRDEMIENTRKMVAYREYLLRLIEAEDKDLRPILNEIAQQMAASAAGVAPLA